MLEAQHTSRQSDCLFLAKGLFFCFCATPSHKRNLQGVHTEAFLCIVQVALDDLGFSPCFHARFMTYLTELFDIMYDYAIGRRPDFPAKHLFRHFNSAVDIPAPLIPLVMKAYPDAKVGNPATTHTMGISALPLVNLIVHSAECLLPDFKSCCDSWS